MFPSNERRDVMRKYIIGMLFGFALAFSVGAHAEVISFINKTVDGMFPVTVDGKTLGNAIVVDNKTFLPAKEFGEAVGYTVTFTDDREVIMTKNTTKTVSELEDNIKTVKFDVRNMKAAIEIAKPDDPYLQEFKDQLLKYKTTLAALEAQLAELQKQ